MAIDAKMTRHIAKLARIGLEDSEIPSVTEKLNDILGWVEKLSEVNVDNVDPISSVSGDSYCDQRDDNVTDGNIRDEILACAPVRSGEFYKVPKVVD